MGTTIHVEENQRSKRMLGDNQPRARDILPYKFSFYVISLFLDAAHASRGPKRPRSGGTVQFLDLSTNRFSAIHGIIARSFSPIFSMSCSAARRRKALKLGWPAVFSRTHSRAKPPDWISAKIF